MFSQSRYNKVMKFLRSYFWICFCLYSVVALWLGWAEWDWGKRAYQDRVIFRCFLEGVLVWVLIRWGLVFPQSKWVWKHEGEGLSRFQAISFSTILLCLPLIGFAYWVGDVRTVLQAQEVAISIVPAVLLSTLIYDTTRKVSQWAFSLWFLIFFQLFLVGEILGPFHPYINLLTHDNRYEYLRALVPALTVAGYFRMNYEPKGRSYLGINSIHHAWKSGRFSKVLKTTDPGEGSLQSQTKTSMRN